MRRMKVIVDECEQLLAGGMGLLQVRHEGTLALLFRLLDEHLGVTDDLIQRRAQGMDQARWQGVLGRMFGLGHDDTFFAEAIAPPLNSASILPSRRGSSMGLVS